jgi:hypothetical protein
MHGETGGHHSYSLFWQRVLAKWSRHSGAHCSPEGKHDLYLSCSCGKLPRLGMRPYPRVLSKTLTAGVGW